MEPLARNKAISYAAETVISSAQNQEDVLLFRAFGGRRTGFYVDVGAGDPNWDSVTSWFYRIGWRGINIEANPLFVAGYTLYRPEDINLNVGVSGTGTNLSFNKVEQNSVGHGWGLSSFESAARDQAETLGFTVNVIDMPTRTLVSVLDEHAASGTIDFLKVDVEGHEGSVLKSNDWTRHRPVVVCVEAVLPNSAEPSHHDWEATLLDNGYLFALFDGVNNYYVRKESAEMLPQFNASVNCNDRFRKIQLQDVV